MAIQFKPHFIPFYQVKTSIFSPPIATLITGLVPQKSFQCSSLHPTFILQFWSSGLKPQKSSHFSFILASFFPPDRIPVSLLHLFTPHRQISHPQLHQNEMNLEKTSNSGIQAMRFLYF